MVALAEEAAAADDADEKAADDADKEAALLGLLFCSLLVGVVSRKKASFCLKRSASAPNSSFFKRSASAPSKVVFAYTKISRVPSQMVLGHNLHYMAPFGIPRAWFCIVFQRASLVFSCLGADF